MRPDEGRLLNVPLVGIDLSVAVLQITRGDILFVVTAIQDIVEAWEWPYIHF